MGKIYFKTDYLFSRFCPNVFKRKQKHSLCLFVNMQSEKKKERIDVKEEDRKNGRERNANM